MDLFLRNPSMLRRKIKRKDAVFLTQQELKLIEESQYGGLKVKGHISLLLQDTRTSGC
jgi:hypothetical protein